MIAASADRPRGRSSIVVPAALEATRPPEQRGIARDGIRLLVATADGLSHRHFRDLPAILEPGDLLVVNTSRTLPAALSARLADGTPSLVHFSGWLDGSRWIVEVRRHDNRGPDLERTDGDAIHLAGGVTLTLERPYPQASLRPSRLWSAVTDPAVEPHSYLAAHGRPITYSHLRVAPTLAEYQTVYADQPGSAEMPSAGRPFTAGLLVELMAAGVTIAPVTLHAGVSSPELHEPPAPERYAVPHTTARLVALTRRAHGRVVAVGTTVARALETVAATGGARGGRGWTELVLGPHRPTRVVNGLITGLHMPESSHLMLLESVAGSRLVADAYSAALSHGYLWHEFGDSMLFLP